MTIRLSLGLVVLAAVLALPPAAPGLAPDVAAGAYPFDLAEVVQRSVAQLTPVSGRIDIAVTNAYESNPRVGICASNQYLVVYQHAAETDPYSIYGQRLTSQGTLLGAPFEIDLQAFEANDPDVACEWSNDRFVVVWHYDYFGDDSDYDVYARAVYGSHQTSGVQLASGLVVVSGDGAGVHESSPAVACNSDDASCLAALTFASASDSEIYGQRLVVTGPGIGPEGERFNISQLSTGDRLPDVAWGSLDQNYLVSWEHYHTVGTGSTWYIMSSLVYDTEQGPPPADELQSEPRFLIDPNAWSNAQATSAVAYNRQAGTPGRYLVVFHNSPGQVAARRVKGTDGTTEGAPFFVAQPANDIYYPDVAASGGPDDSGTGADQFLVTYFLADESSNFDFLFGQGVRGTHAATGSQLDGPAVELARSQYSTDDAELGLGGVTGSAHNGRYAVVWRDRDRVSLDGIHGRLFAPYGVHLPLVVRNH